MKLLLLDIESSGLSASFSTTLCFGYKWLGDKATRVLSIGDYDLHKKDPTDDSKLLTDVKKIMLEADVWCTWYGARFDIPFLQTRMLYAGLGALPSTPHIDLWKISRTKLRMHSNRLAAVSEFFGLTGKTAVLGRAWIRAQCGHGPSLKYISAHCVADVECLEDAYNLMRPLIKLHPNVALIDGKPRACPVCGAEKLQSRGFSYSRIAARRRFQCTLCGAWSSEGKSVKTTTLR